MLDSDLAKLYGTETKFVNRAVTRNRERFPPEFTFQLSSEEWTALRFHFGTLNESGSRGKHRKFLPFVYSEQGIAMLSAVLSTPIAIKMSIQIIRSFIELRKKNQSLGILFEKVNQLDKWKGDTDLKIEEIFRVIGKNDFPKSGIFFNDQIFDAYVFASEIITKAKKSIILIDNYIDESTLIQLSKRNKRASCLIYTEKLTEQLMLDLQKHNAQYPPINIHILKNVHDRFLIIDQKELYHLGASLKDLGKRWFGFSRIDSVLNQVIERLE